MTLKIYGIARSRAIRTLWMANELGIPHELVETSLGPDGTRSPAFLAINPHGQAPAIDDDGVIVWESLAINLYLARRHGGPLAPANLAEEGQMTAWSFWAAIAVEPHAAMAMYHTYVLAPEARDPALVAQAMDKLKAPLDVLEATLARDKFLVGGRFTVADLNLVGVLFYLRFTPEVLAEKPATRTYYETSLARPAARAAWALRGE